MKFEKPIIVVSKCLEFEKVRYNGQVMPSQTVKDLIPFVEFIKVCPEYEIGLGVPREPIRIVKDTAYGEIKFLEIVNGTGNNFTNEIRIGNNSATVESTLNSGLNKSANITLYGIGNRGFSNPTILKNGANCDSCYNYTSLTANTVIFNVTYWTNYSIGEHQNAPPTITYIQQIPNTDLTEENYTNVEFNVTVSDENGASDINYSSVIANFTREGETLRSGSCTNISGQDTPTTMNFSCTIEMWYWDENGNWNITVTASDNNGESAINTTEYFQINLLQAIKIAPNGIFWNNLVSGAENQTASNSTVINNTGNYNATGKIEINATNLYNGEFYIDVANISMGTDTGSECNGTFMQASEDVAVSGVVLERGNLTLGTSNDTIYYCMIEVPSNLPSGTYDTTTAGAWTIRLFLAAVTLGKRKKKRKKKRVIGHVSVSVTIFNKKLGAAEALVKYLRENLKLRYSQIAELLNRDERTVWTVYKKAAKKQKAEIRPEASDIFIPTSVFKDRELTILESLIVYLRNNGMKNVEVAEALERDARNTHAVYSKAKKKLR
jgi:hypothetical protein